MHQTLLIASSLFATIALCTCIVHPKPAPKYSRDFTFPTEATPIRELPVWEWPFLGANNHNAAPHRAKRQVVATIDDIQLSRCAEYLAHGAYTHPRLLFVWYGDDQPSDPVEFLRTVLSNDLGLGHLAFSLQRVKEQPNRMLFELSSRLQAFEVLRNYCQLFSQTATYRAHGYDDPPLDYEFLQTDQDFRAAN